ncbi:MAG: restriction endonuclease [Chloroflexi bacterium]|nr:restriction endonuclease [Chloroflexota bacterium]
MSGTTSILELAEYQPVTLTREQLPCELGSMLWQAYGAKIDVEFPSPKTGDQWLLTSKGWVGHISLAPDLGIALVPKVPLYNLFGMWEYAYRLQSFKFLDDMTAVASLEAVYEQLAMVLAKRVLDRVRRGVCREYIPRHENLPFLRGRISIVDTLTRPGESGLSCYFHEHSPDIVHNQVLLWTLQRILRAGVCTERTLPTVRRAFRALRGTVGMRPFTPRDCVHLGYNRLNDDYWPLHALCRFFLEQSGPSHRVGDREMVPFLVDMARLFELFVAEWLNAHLPAWLLLKAQEMIVLDEAAGLHFDIDLVLVDRSTGMVRCVLDTKYKAASSPAEVDIQKATAYAESTGCRDAYLIYPRRLAPRLDVKVGRVRVRSLTFVLDGDLEEAGQAFLKHLLEGCPQQG